MPLGTQADLLLSRPHVPLYYAYALLRKTVQIHFCEMSNRPTLPPLRTLGLPNPCSNLRKQMAGLRVNDTNDTYDSLVSQISSFLFFPVNRESLMLLSCRQIASNTQLVHFIFDHRCLTIVQLSSTCHRQDEIVVLLLSTQYPPSFREP